MKSGYESLGRLKSQALFLLFAVFAIGVFAGVAGTRLLSTPQGPPQKKPPKHEHPDRPGLPPHLTEKLSLTSEQETQIDEILQRSQSRTDAIFEEFMPRVRATTDSVRAEIRAILTPEQQKTFDEMEPPFRDGPFPGRRPPGKDHRRPGGPGPGGPGSDGPGSDGPGSDRPSPGGPGPNDSGR
ncbi:MAG: hypothetical protein R3E97_11230 [Candidatus Eisenbacteria bacterium]